MLATYMRRMRNNLEIRIAGPASRSKLGLRAPLVVR